MFTPSFVLWDDDECMYDGVIKRARGNHYMLIQSSPGKSEGASLFIHFTFTSFTV